MIRVLFVSIGNSCRSIMAEGIANHHYHGRVQAFSAGVDASEIHPNSLAVLDEIGINIDEMHVNSVEDYKDQDFDYIITLCDYARESCPVFWTKGEAVYKHINFEDPSIFSGTEEQKLKYFRDIRDNIEEKVMDFFDEVLKSTPQFHPESRPFIY